MVLPANSRYGINVVIPCFNDGRFLDDNIASILAQNTRAPFRIIIVDDCSTDSLTIDTLSRLSKNPHITVLRTDKNCGVSAARNYGLDYIARESAPFSYVLMLDADDRLTSNPKILKRGSYLDQICNILERRKFVSMVIARIKMFGNAEHPFMKWQRYDEKFHILHSAPNSFVAFRLQDALEAGKYNPDVKYHGDLDFTLALMNAKVKDGERYRIHFIPQQYIEYRIRGDSTSMSDTIEQYDRTTELRDIIARNTEIFQKHFGPDDVDTLLARVMKERNIPLTRRFWIKESLKDCIRYPATAFVPGGPGSYFVFRVKDFGRRRGGEIADAMRNSVFRLIRSFPLPLVGRPVLDFSYSLKGGRTEGVSVIVPCYNSGRYVEEMVQSVIAQNTKRPYEIVICDDCSTDDTPQILAALEKKYRCADGSPIIVLTATQENGGECAARNQALKAAQYKYIFAYDSDDRLAVFGRSILDWSADMLELRPDVMMVYARRTEFERSPQLYHMGNDFDEKHHLANFGMGCCIAYRRDEAIAAGGYDPSIRLAPDWDFINAMIEHRFIADRKMPRTVKFIPLTYFEIRKRNDCSSIMDSVRDYRDWNVTKKISIHKHPHIYYHHFGMGGDVLYESIQEEITNHPNRKTALMKHLAGDTWKHPTTAFNKAGPVPYAWLRLKDYAAKRTRTISARFAGAAGQDKDESADHPVPSPEKN